MGRSASWHWRPGSEVKWGPGNLMLRSFFKQLMKCRKSAVVFCRCGDASIVSTSDHGELRYRSSDRRRLSFRRRKKHKVSKGHILVFAKSRLSRWYPIVDVIEPLNLNENHRLESHLGVLFDIARIRPICLILDDVQRSDTYSIKLLEAIDQRVRDTPGVQLLLIASDTIPLKNKQELERADQTDNPNIEIFERSYADVTEFIHDV